MEEGSKFCRHCGKPAETAQPSTPRSDNERVNYYANGTHPGEHGYNGNSCQWHREYGRPGPAGAERLANASLIVSIIGAFVGYLAFLAAEAAARNPGNEYGDFIVFLLFTPLIAGSVLGAVGIAKSGQPGTARDRSIAGLAIGCSAILVWVMAVSVAGMFVSVSETI